MPNDRGDLEAAILDAEGSLALLYTIEAAYLQETSAGPARLGIMPPKGVYVFAFEENEYLAMTRAINLLGADLKAVSKAFYAYRPDLSA